MGQLASYNSVTVTVPAIPALVLRFGRGTDGGLVVHLSAAKYKQSAGPGQEYELLSNHIPAGCDL